jgi:MarR family
MQPGDAKCSWCGQDFPPRRGGSPQRFCSAKHRSLFWAALRRWRERAVAAGLLTAANHGLSIAEIARALDLDKGSGSRRVKVAISKGYLVNEEPVKGKPARIVLGDPMPDASEILPHPDTLADRCTVAATQAGIDTSSPPADCDTELAEVEI